MLHFEWDENKNKLNQQKHNITFEDATDIFNDENRLEYSSDRKEEARNFTIGKAFMAIISVIYTTRNLVIRIISARRASQDERRIYLSHKLKNKKNGES